MSIAETLQTLKEFDTALLANTIERIDPVLPELIYMGGQIRCLTPSIGPTVGLAITCEVDSSTPSQKMEWDAFYEQLDEIRRIEEPVFWVVKAVGARPEHECVLGDGIGKLLYSVGCAGVITDGGVRDVNGLLTVPFAVHARYTIAHHCALRAHSTGKPIEVGGLLIRPGDILHADHEGIIRIPQSCLDRLSAEAIKVRAFENEAHGVLRQPNLTPGQKREIIDGISARYTFTRNKSA